MDPSGLTLHGNRITGTARVVANIDPYLAETASGVAGRITLDATSAPDASIQGTYSAVWGEAWESKGTASGTVDE